jgi:hypothetical protein
VTPDAPTHHHAGILVLVSALAWGLVLLGSCGVLPGCLTPAQLVAAEPTLDGLVAAGCVAEEAAIPIPGLGALACAGEEAALHGAIAAEIDSQAAAPAAAAAKPDAGAPPRKTLFRHGKPPEPPLVKVGSLPAGAFADAVQRRLLGPRPHVSPIAAPPAAPVATPPLDAGAAPKVAPTDAGRDGAP